MTDETVAVEVRDLTRKFGAFTAVDRVTLDVGVGEIFGFLGPNGAGKTTVIKMLTGLLLPSAGRAKVAGFDLLTQAEAIKQRIGYMSQLFSLYGDLTVNENITLFAGLYGVSGERLRQRRGWILDMAGLSGQQDRATAELPLGWKQRLALGCAVLHEPAILFLDEPTSGVDPLSRRSFWDLIYALAEQGTTVFVSTHYIEEAEFCHRVALMNRGKLIALGTPAELRQGLGEPMFELETADVLRAMEVLRRAPGVIDATMFGRRIHLIASHADAGSEIAQTLASQGVLVQHVAPLQPSLEDAVVALIRQASEGER